MALDRRRFLRGYRPDHWPDSFGSFQKINTERARGQSYQEMVREASTARTLLFEFLIFHEERMYEQWAIKEKSLTRLLTAVQLSSPREKLLLEDARKNLEWVKTIFFDIKTIHDRHETHFKQSQPATMPQMAGEILTGQLLLRSQAFVSSVLQLADESQKKIVSAQHTFGLLFILLMGGLIGVIAAISFLISRHIVKSIGRLRDGAEVIGSGDLEFRIDALAEDEFGQLSIAFNEMAKNLKSVTASRDELDREITEREQAVEALRKSEEVNRATFDQAAIGIAHVGIDGKWLRVNDKLCAIVGYTRDELMKLTFQDITYRDDLETDLDYVRQVLSGERHTYSMEKRYIRKDRSLIWINLTVSLVRTASGEPIHFISIIEDISARKSAEERFRIAAESLSDVIYEWDLGDAIDWYGDVDALMGYAQGKFPRTMAGWGATLHPDDRDRIMDAVDRQLKGEVPYDVEYRLLKKDGSFAWWTARGTAIRDADGKPVRWIGAITDITEHKRAEEALKKNELKFRALTDTSPLAIYMSSGVEQMAEYINPTFIKLFGYTLEEIPSAKQWWPLAYPDEEYRKQISEEWQKKVEYAIATHSEIEPMEVVVTCKDGSKKNISWGYISTGIQNWAFGMDLTERKRAEKSLIQEKNFSESVISSLPGIFYLFDEKGKFVRWNKNFLDVSGYSGNDLSRMTPVDFFMGGDIQKIAENVEKVFKDGWASVEADFVSRDGKKTPYIFTGVRIELDGSSYLAGTGIDITHRVRAEEIQRQYAAALERSKKELEQVLYATSHDLRSPLVNIQGFSKELLASIRDLDSLMKKENVPSAFRGKSTVIMDKDIPESLQYILSSAKKMDSLLSALLTLSRLGRQKADLKHLDMNKIMADVISEFEFQIKEQHVTLSITPLPDCEADALQINRVFSNLLGNALKFLDPERPGVIRISGQKEKDHAIYRMEDNGIGMKPGNMSKIFDLFHRLDPAKPGIGLGLSIVKQVVDSLNGTIGMVSQPGEGTTVTVTLPLRNQVRSFI